MPGGPRRDSWWLPCGTSQRNCLRISAEAQPFTLWGQMAQFWKLSIGYEDFLRPNCGRNNSIAEIFTLSLLLITSLFREINGSYSTGHILKPHLYAATQRKEILSRAKCKQRVVWKLLTSESPAERQAGSFQSTCVWRYCLVSLENCQWDSLRIPGFVFYPHIQSIWKRHFLPTPILYNYDWVFSILVK